MVELVNTVKSLLEFPLPVTTSHGSGSFLLAAFSLEIQMDEEYSLSRRICWKPDPTMQGAEL
jgi:hypothetical protein